MRIFSTIFFARTTALAALTLGCSMVACGGGDSTNEPGPDTGEEGGADSTTDARPDTPTDTGTDAKDSTTDSADTGHDTGTDTGHDTGVDTGHDTGVDTGTDSSSDAGADSSVDSGTDLGVDTGSPDTAICTPGTLCSDGKICSSDGSACNPCGTDTDCSSIASGTICFGDGTCKTAQCIPGADTVHCTSGQLCCATASSAGTCEGPASAGTTVCCSDSDCSGLTGTTTCDVASHTCVCPAPTAGQLFVSTTGSDTAGNGSSSCPFATIQHAVDTLAASPPSTISNVQIAAGTYGPACSAASCDPATITIPASINSGLTVNGSGLTVIDSAFVVNAVSTWFQGMTIVPPAGANGILFDAPRTTLGVEGIVSDVAIDLTGTSGAGVVVRGGTSPTIGPAFEVAGGAHGVLVTQSTAAGAGASSPTLVASPGATTLIQGTSLACVRVQTIAGGVGGAPTLTLAGDPSSRILLEDCGGLGGIVDEVTSVPAAPLSVSNVDVTRSVISTGTFTGIHLLNSAVATISNTAVGVTSGGGSGLGAIGIAAEGSSSLTISGNVSSNGNTRGLSVTGTAVANIDGLTANDNTGGVNADGLFCNSAAKLPGTPVTLSVRNSTFLGNSGSGLHVPNAAVCVVDLGSSTSAGNNTFNIANHRNVGAGLCYLTTSGPAADVTASTWACSAVSPPDTGCNPSGGAYGTPTTSPGGVCVGGVDFAFASPGPGSFLPLGQTCCAD